MVRFHWAAASPRRDVSPFRAHRTRSLSRLLLSTRRPPQALDADRIRLPPRHLPNHHGHPPSDRMHHGHADVWPFRALQPAPARAGHRRWPHAARDLEIGFLHPLRGDAQKVAVPSAHHAPSACGPSPDRAGRRPGMEKVSQGLCGLPPTRKRASRRPRLGPVFGQVRRLPSDLGTAHRAIRRTTVRYWYEDHQTQAIQHETLPVLRFIGRMVQHLLPKGFQRVRYYGLHSHIRYEPSAIRWSNSFPATHRPIPMATASFPANRSNGSSTRLFGRDPLLCPRCHTPMDWELMYHPEYGILKEEQS